MNENPSAFLHDCDLPPLPVPAWADTCRRLKSCVAPLVDGAALEKTAAALDAFGEAQAPQLQEALLRLAASDAFNESWLRPIWDDRYLSFRGCLPVNMNYAFQLAGDRWGSDPLPAFLSALAAVAAKMRVGALSPEPAREGFLSMDTLACMLYTRIPGRIRDVLYSPPLFWPLTASVVCGGHWFILSLTDGRGRVLSPAAVANALAEIQTLAGGAPPASPVGAITCCEREDAAALREALQASPENRMNLERLEKSVFTVCLDEPLAEGENFSRRLLAGSAGNRWFDKSLQIVRCGGRLGVNMEHSGCDAGIWVYLLNQADTLRADAAPAGGEAHILPLRWSVSEALSQRLAAAAARHRDTEGRLCLETRRITAVSKDMLKRMGYSPDAFVQLLFQTAYYRLTGRLRSVYEAVSTRAFYQGRTECVRPVTEASAAFVRAFCGGAGGAELADRFRAAAGAHEERLKQARGALGPERHMAGLFAMAQIRGIAPPDIFADAGYKTLCHDALSTSSVAAPFLDFFSFGPVVEDGLGIGYGVNADALHAAVSAFRGGAAAPGAFMDELESAARAFYEFLT